MGEARLHKVAILVTREGSDGPELLVFDHDRSAVQVPAGTVEPGEDLRAAAIRELEEEAGIVVDDVTHLDTFPEYPQPDERFCAESAPLLDAPDAGARVLVDDVFRVVLRLHGERDGWADVSREEWDLAVDPPQLFDALRGWIRQDALTPWQMRHLFHAHGPHAGPQTWELVAEDVFLFRCRWAPLDDTGLLEHHQSWVDRVRDRLPQ